MHERGKPHDSLLKSSLKDVDIMRDWLTAPLPKRTLALLDLDTLELMPNEHIPKWPDSLCSDLVYRCKIKACHKEKYRGYIYLAQEHQSQPDKMIPFRFLCYLVEDMKDYLKQGNKKLPIVLPLLLYHGKVSPYPYSCEIWDCFENPDLAKELMFKPLQLIDLTVLPDEEIHQHGLASVMEFLLKNYSRRESPLPWLKKLLSDGKMTTIYTTKLAYFKDILSYFIEVCGKSKGIKDSDELDRALALWVQAVPRKQRRTS